MSIKLEFAERLKKLPPYLFAEIDKAKREAIKEGKDIIDLGIGDPDMPTPRFVIDKLKEAADNPKNHRYALDLGMPELRQAIAEWYKRRFNVTLDPQREIQPLIGSKEGIAHIPLAFINPGDNVLVPDPCYPPYKSGTIFAGGTPYIMPLLSKNNFLPELEKVPSEVLRKTKMLFLNYPNNPTSAVAEKDFLPKVVDFANKNNVLVCYDAAYSEVAYDGYKPMSFLEVDGGKEVGIEFHSLSKTCNMTGWRIGWACGNEQAVQGLGKVKSNVDSGIFQAIQLAGVSALLDSDEHVRRMNVIYQERRDALISGLDSIGWKVPKPKATFYVWAPIPDNKYNSTGLAGKLLKEASIVITPGVGFGENGEGYVRMALTVDKERIKEAVERIKKVL